MNGQTAEPRRRAPGRGWRIATPVVALLAGLMFATSAVTAQGQDLRGSRDDLADVVRDRDAELAGRARDVAALRRSVEAAQRSTGAADPAVARMRATADRSSRQAGLTPVTGPAVSVTLDDAHHDGPLPDDIDPDDVVVHQQDVQAVVNALWAAGAEAMTIQDQRVVATSAVRCVGNTLVLQGRVYSPPFTVTAIGDPARLRAGLEADPYLDVYRQYVDQVGLGYRVDDPGTVAMPAYDGTLALRHARAATGKEPADDDPDTPTPGPADTGGAR